MLLTSINITKAMIIKLRTAAINVPIARIGAFSPEPRVIFH